MVLICLLVSEPISNFRSGSATTWESILDKRESSSLRHLILLIHRGSTDSYIDPVAMFRLAGHLESSSATDL